MPLTSSPGAWDPCLRALQISALSTCLPERLNFQVVGVIPTFANWFMPEKTLSEKGPGGGGSIVVSKYLQIKTRDGAVWGDDAFLEVSDCNHGRVGSPADWDKEGMNPAPRISYLCEEQTIHIPAVSLAEEIGEVVNTHVQHVVDTVEVEKSKTIQETLQRTKLDIPVVLVMQVARVQVLVETAEVPQLMSNMQISQVRVAAKTVEIPQSLFSEKIVEIPEAQTVQGTRTSESFREILMRGVAPNIEADSFIDDLCSVGGKGSNHQDCEVLFHAGKKRTIQQPDSSQQ